MYQWVEWIFLWQKQKNSNIWNSVLIGSKITPYHSDQRSFETDVKTFFDSGSIIVLFFPGQNCCIVLPFEFKYQWVEWIFLSSSDQRLLHTIQTRDLLEQMSKLSLIVEATVDSNVANLSVQSLQWIHFYSHCLCVHCPWWCGCIGCISDWIHHGFVLGLDWTLVLALIILRESVDPMTRRADMLFNTSSVSDHRHHKTNSDWEIQVLKHFKFKLKSLGFQSH